MMFRALDSSDDWTFGRGINSYLLDAEAMKANLKTRIKLWRGECFFAIQDGVDWNNFLGIGTKALLDSDLKRIILASDGILAIDAYTSALDSTTRNLNVQATLRTIFGKLSLNEVF